MGFDIEAGELYTALSAARSLVQRRSLRPMFMLSDSALDDFRGVPTHEPNAVVVGLAPEHFNYARMTDAVNLLLKENSTLIAVHKVSILSTCVIHYFFSYDLNELILRVDIINLNTV